MGGFSTTMRWLETVALGAFVFQLTGSPFAVGSIFFFRMIPMLALGALIGIIADRANRKYLLVVAMSSLSVLYAGLAVLVLTDHIEYWHVALGALGAGTVWATDFPVRRALIGDVVGHDSVRTAMGIDMATSNFARIPGPLLAGVFLATVGMEAVYLMGAALFGIASLVALTLPYTSPPRVDDGGRPFGHLVEGLTHVRRDRLIVTTLVITVIMNVFAFPYQSMVPVITEESLGVGSLLLGVLVSVEGMGATLGAVLVATRVRQQQYTKIYVLGSALFLIMVIAFTRVSWYWAALPLLFVGGFGMAGFGTMQSIIVISATPSEVRGRVLGVLAVTIGTGPIAALALGALAQGIGATDAVLAMALTGVVALALTVALSPHFLRARSFEPRSTVPLKQQTAGGAAIRPSPPR